MKPRRDAIKILLPGAAISLLPDRWTKPVFSGIVLPAHAQTSGAAIALTGSGSLTDAGGEVTFEEAQIVASNTALKFLITLDAKVDPSTVDPDDDINKLINVETADLFSKESGNGIRIGNTDVNECSDGPVTFIPVGRNTIEIEFSNLAKIQQYNGLRLSFYSRLCAPRFLGPMDFEINIPA